MSALVFSKRDSLLRGAFRGEGYFADMDHTSAQHYSVMLTQLSELRQELEKSVSQNQILNEQNHSLQALYNTIKSELAESKKKYNEAQENYLNTVTEKFEIEKQNEIFLESLKYQLTEKTKEFELLRDKFAPQDIDYIRIKVQEELEIPHKSKIQMLEKEIEKQRESYFTVRRNYELLKVEYETKDQNYHRDITNLKELHSMELLSMKKTISNLRDREYSPEKDEQLRNLSMKYFELENQLKAVTQEAKTMRTERDNALSSAESAKSRNDDLYLSLRTRCSVLETENHSAAHKNAGLLQEVEKKDNTIHNLTQGIEEVEKQLTYYKNLASDRESHILREKSEHEHEVENIREIFEKQINDLDEKNIVLQHKLRDREESLRRSQRDANEMQLRAESLESEVRKSYFHQLLETRQKIESLELEIAEHKEAHRQNEIQLKLSIEQATLESDRLRSENSRLSREKEVLHGHLRDMELRVDTEKRSVADAKKAKEEAQRLLKARDAETVSTRQAVDQLKFELAELTDGVVKKENEHKRQWEYVQSEVQKRYESLGNAYKKKLEECIKKGRSAVLKERKRADAYKSRALELQRKHKSYQVTTAST